MHDRAGQGASAFRAFLRALPDDIARQRDEGFPIVLERDGPLAPHAQRLMDSLGVEVRIVSDTAVDRVRRPAGTHTEGHYIVDAERQPFVENPIDFRHSLVQAAKRADLGDETLEICPHCMCEVDIDPQPHRPGCPGIGKPRTTSAPVLAKLAEEDSSSERAADPEPEGAPQLPAPAAGGLDDQPPPITARTAEATDATGEPEPGPAPDGASSRWDRDSIIAAIVAWNAAHGLPPTSVDWARMGDDHPHAQMVKRVFGRWADAVEAAGFPRPRRGVKPALLAKPPATSEERAPGPVGATAGARSSGAADEAATETFGLTLEQLVAAGHAIDAIASKLMHLDSPRRVGVRRAARRGGARR